jgi:hypothetical protein
MLGHEVTLAYDVAPCCGSEAAFLPFIITSRVAVMTEGCRCLAATGPASAAIRTTSLPYAPRWTRRPSGGADDPCNLMKMMSLPRESVLKMFSL